MPALTPEAIYQQLGSLVAEMPDLAHGPITPEMNRWLGRATLLVELAPCDMATVINFRVAAQSLQLAREMNAQTIAAIIHQALAVAEFRAPASAQGAFIAAGHTLDAFGVVGKAMSEAKSDVLMVDPYADHKALTDYAVLAPDNVSVRLLAKNGRSDLLKPAVDRWRQQWGNARPLAVRLAPANTLHDRLILVDRKTAWMVGQSFNALAERAHTALARLPPEAGAEKIAAYETMWTAAQELS